MEEEKNDHLKKNPLLKQNTLEKLIKLDQKNSSLSPFKHKNRRRLLIRDQALNTDFSWTPNQIEQGLYIFWNHIDQYYFKNVREDDMEQIDLLIESMELVIKDLSLKYAGFDAYEAFKKIVAPKYKKLILDQALSKINLQNLKKKYFISSSKLLRTTKGSKSGSDHQNFSYDVNALKAAKKKNKLAGFLSEETKQLTNALPKNEEKSTKSNNAIDLEIEKLSKEYKKMNETNSDHLIKLKNKAAKQKTVLDINELINPSPEPERRVLAKRAAGSNQMNNKTADSKNTMVNYLKKLIIRLENQQAAESIKYVIDCKKPESARGQYQFCVIFDEALSHNECWVDEPILDQLDKLREQSLFKVYKIPQKLYHSVNSGNLTAFHSCDQQVMSHAPTLKEKPWKDLMKKGFIEGTKGFNKEDLFMKSKEFGLCHHCKYLFPDEFLIKCTYRTSELKPPTINSEYLNPVATHGRIPKRSMWNNRLSISSFYQKRNGELICSRAYCRLCLKQNFDIKSSDAVHKLNWICPFCDGVCNCSRCLRHDHINKLMSLYSILGGKLDGIKQESYLEKYVQNSIPFDPKQNPSRKLSYYALKPTRGPKSEKQVSSEVKGKVSMYKENLEQYQSLKDLRMNLERMRILCSQISKRENIKTKLEAINNKITEEGLDKGKKIAIYNGPKARKLRIEDLEPPVSKKRKLIPGLKPTKRSIRANSISSGSEEEEEEEDSELEDEEEDSLLKKKLKRKNKQVEKLNKRKATKEEVPIKRKRGRPRKIRPEELEYEGDEYRPEEEQDEEAFSEYLEELSNQEFSENDEEISDENSEYDDEEDEDDEDQEEEMESNEDYASNEDEEGDEDEEEEEEEEFDDEDEIEEDEEEEEEEEEEIMDERYAKNSKIIEEKIKALRKSNQPVKRRGRPPKISNPNEPRDFDEEHETPRKPYRLKKELQKLLNHQSSKQFEVFTRTPGSKRATRSSSHKKSKKLR